jgi:hypothetical protein
MQELYWAIFASGTSTRKARRPGYGDMTIRQFPDKHSEQYNPAYIALTKNDNSYLG